VAYRVRASFLPGRSSTILNKAKELLVAEVDLTKPSAALFEPSSVFIVPLMERLRLPSDVLGVANPKSTTGRLDILTRLITEYGDKFDQVPRGYSGELFVEIVSRTFPVYVRAGMKLNQLRFVRGNPAPTGDRPLQERAREDALVYDEETPALASIDRGLAITVDLQGNGSDIVAYKAKRHAPVIELDKINHYEMDDYWEIIRRPNSDRYILEPSSFYLLTSRQKVRVPPDQAAEMVPYDPTMGEFRLHYAGFFDPGWPKIRTKCMAHLLVLPTSNKNLHRVSSSKPPESLLTRRFLWRRPPRSNRLPGLWPAYEGFCQLLILFL
jgi:dCTP deaminase